MLIRKMVIAAFSVLILVASAFGAVTADEAKKLGTTLTDIGAEKAGNADGTIPAYTGGLTTPPAGFKKGSGKLADPFANEKRLFSIDSKNIDKYSSNLTAGTIALMKAYPTYRIDVYPTHRTVAFPKYINDNTKKAALTATIDSSNLTFKGAHAAYPFPIPKTGSEAMWNHLIGFNGGLAVVINNEAYIVNAYGKKTMVSKQILKFDRPYWDMKDTSGLYLSRRITYVGPARRVGEAILALDPIDMKDSDRRAWQYLPGQRRVKLAPDISHDTPNTTVAGVSCYDDVYMFDGRMDRFDFKIIGKKEMYIPYNDYKMVFDSKSENLFKPKHLNPDLIRWELHRVWVVEAKLKPGARHLYSKRTIYLDEDSWAALAAEYYDGRGQLYRVGYSYMTPSYDIPAPVAVTFGHYDLISGVYSVDTWPGESGSVISQNVLFPPSEFTPSSLASGGVR
jgi:hypothetical protein